jgi:hypothetical protein
VPFFDHRLEMRGVAVPHTYKILEPFTAIEATHPPAEIHDRDHPAGQQ